MDNNLLVASKVDLRPFEPDDSSSIGEYLNHPSIIGRRYIPLDKDITLLSKKQLDKILEEWCKVEKTMTLAIIEKNANRIIGHATAGWWWDTHCPSISVVIHPDFQRENYGSDVAKALLRYLFLNTAAHQVSCWLASWNSEARSFAKKLGFVENGGQRRVDIRQGKYYDFVVADILKREWIDKHGGT
ncbi:MAG: GNAT family N-acetyltransferase [Candidatus Hodarchaeales archaeon]